MDFLYKINMFLTYFIVNIFNITNIEHIKIVFNLVFLNIILLIIIIMYSALEYFKIKNIIKDSDHNNLEIFQNIKREGLMGIFFKKNIIYKFIIVFAILHFINQ